MKLNKIFLALLVSFIAVLAIGCNNSTQPANQNDEAVAAKDEQVAVPEEEPTLVGMVKDIVGNEVTVYIAEAPNRMPGQPPDQPPEQPPANVEASGEKPPDAAGQAADPNNVELRPGDRAPGLEVTGETETFIIPADTPIVTLQRGSNETIQMDLTDIKADQLLWVWQKDDAVYYVQVMGGVGPRTGNPEDTSNNGSDAANSKSMSGN